VEIKERIIQKIATRPNITKRAFIAHFRSRAQST